MGRRDDSFEPHARGRAYTDPGSPPRRDWHDEQNHRVDGPVQREERSPWEGERRYAHDRYEDDERDTRFVDEQRADRSSPGRFGERSYGGYGDWPGPEYESIRIGREGFDVEEPNRFLEGRRRARSGAARWGLGRSGVRDDRRNEPYPAGAAVEEARAGRFAGRGPRGYQRSDERIREDVCDGLLVAADVDASDLTVEVRDGEVTLAGNVPSRRMKRAAEDLAEQVAGVKQVHNQLRVEIGEGNAVPELGR